MSEHQKTTQADLSDQPTTKDHQKVEKFALFVDGVNLTEILADLEQRVSTLETP